MPSVLQAPPAEEKKEVYQVIADFSAETATELTLRTGEIVFVLEKDASGWWRGIKDDGSNGWFPPEFLQLVPSGPSACNTIDSALPPVSLLVRKKKKKTLILILDVDSDS